MLTFYILIFIDNNLLEKQVIVVNIEINMIIFIFYLIFY